MSPGLKQEILAYDEMRRELESDHFGEWVVVHNRQVAGTYESFQEAAKDAVQRFGRGPYLIRRIGVGPAPLPVSLVYRGSFG